MIVSAAAAGATTQTNNLTISSFDNARFTMVASTTVDIIPATNEGDSGMIVLETFVAAGDRISISSNGGTNYVNMQFRDGVLAVSADGDTMDINAIGNSTGRYRIVTDGTVGTRVWQRVITTLGLLA